MAPIRTAACVGGGVIGGGWAARLLLNGIDVRVHDPAPGARERVEAILGNARLAYELLAGDGLPIPGRLTVCDDIATAVDGAALVQESVPERLDLKRRVLAEIDRATPPDVPITSSTSGLLPTRMQEGLRHPQRLLVGHPFNPVYLLPLVELVAGEQTATSAIDRAAEIYTAIGMRPVRIAKEIDAFVGDRLQEALWREALWLVHDDVADVTAVDDVIRYSFGLRWAQMGVFQVYRTGGGEAGMRHFLAQFGPALKWPWTRLMDVPELDDALLDKITAQSDAQAGDADVQTLERIRDRNLVAIMQALEGDASRPGWGAGALLTDYRRRLAEAAGPDRRVPASFTHTVTVPTDWDDGSGRVPAFRDAALFADASAALLAAHAAGEPHPFRGVRLHAERVGEPHPGAVLVVHSTVIEVSAQALRLAHTLTDDTGTTLARAQEWLAATQGAPAGLVDALAARPAPGPEAA